MTRDRVFLAGMAQRVSDQGLLAMIELPEHAKAGFGGLGLLASRRTTIPRGRNPYAPGGVSVHPSDGIRSRRAGDQRVGSLRQDVFHGGFGQIAAQNLAEFAAVSSYFPDYQMIINLNQIDNRPH